MKFDYCISNPAFNVAQDNNVAGTGGYTTLYRTATRNDFQNRLKDGGTLVNITLKGIITDLTKGHFKDYQTDRIDLMDTIDMWPYNTCFFIVKKIARATVPTITGGLAAKIFTTDETQLFPFTYYSGSDTSMNKWFHATGKNKVIRRLPGKNSKSPIYDFTDKDVSDNLPKFAFPVLESSIGHYVTTEPIYGGTISYISTKTIQEAEALKLFVQRNPVYKMYIERMRQEKNASHSLRNVRRFDLSQIKTGLETPVEWNILPEDLAPPVKLNNDITEDRNRVKALGEVFTPTDGVNIVLDAVQQNDPMAFIDTSKSFIDSMAGDGQFLVEILNRKLKNGITYEDALSTIYGIDLTQENVDVCKKRLLNGNSQYQHIVDANIVCADSLGKTFT